jgi:hypothetical protein
MKFFRWVFIITGIIGFLIIGGVGNQHRVHEDDVKLIFIGICLIVSSILIHVLLNRIEPHFNEHEASYKRHSLRFACSVLLIIAGTSDLIYALIGIIDSSSKSIDGFIAISGGGALVIGVFMFRSIAIDKI